MIKFKHNTCTSHIISYIGDSPLTNLGNPIIRSADWQRPNGDSIEPYSKIDLVCPDCGKKLIIKKRLLDEIVVMEPIKSKSDPVGLRGQIHEYDSEAIDIIVDGTFEDYEEYHSKKYGYC